MSTSLRTAFLRPLAAAVLVCSVVSAASAAALPIAPAKIDKTVERAMREFEVPGIAVGIVKDGKLVFAKGYGVRELGKPGRVDADTLFQIGSNTKAFTAAAQAKWYGFTEQSVVTAFMPLFHVAGMQASMSAGLYAGAALVIMSRWDKSLIPALFERHGVTYWNAAPTMIADVLESPDFTERTFAALKTLTGGGASMPAAVAGLIL